MLSSRVSIPGRVVKLLLTDDQFFREVSSAKKVASAGSFPKYDQWCDEFGFHMEFALAGYAKSDIEVLGSGQSIIIRSIKTGNPGIIPQAILDIAKQKCGVADESQIGDISEIFSDSTQEETPKASAKIQQGSIVRGIARRNFSSDFFISDEFDVSETKATVKNGLLHLLIPEKSGLRIKTIEILDGE